MLWLSYKDYKSDKLPSTCYGLHPGNLLVESLDKPEENVCTPEKAYKRGCAATFAEYVKSHSPSTVLVVAVFMLSFITCACCLSRKVNRDYDIV